jgi:hypothetical protein
MYYVHKNNINPKRIIALIKDNIFVYHVNPELIGEQYLRILHGWHDEISKEEYENILLQLL